MIYHLTAFIAGFLLDLLIGDPHGFPHPVIWIGKLISKITDKALSKAKQSEKTILQKNQQKLCAGRLMVMTVIFISGVVTALLVISAYIINSYLGFLVEMIITWQCLATKSLYTESMKVYKALKYKSLEDGRYAVSMIVGRDTQSLDEAGVARAAVETVAENTSDGIIAPMLYLAIGGPVLGIIYKAINTMDSMVGYKNDKFLYFGRAAAHLDDIANYIPSRISAWLMIASCYIGGKDFNAKNARIIFQRDRYNHASPNSAQTESVCAGALGLRLAGPSSYFGKKVDKPYIGDNLRNIEIEDIKRVNRLMIITAFLSEIICSLILAGCIL
ncbi:MAG: adenosylcobinamide-phosphate synthase CbiB [Butyrivibrio sp.]|nr:adenosylcobinamide-phosphate synthase CbiB [Butyrivibrio sp.]